MLKWLYLILANMLGTSLARVLSGAALSLVSFAGLAPLVLSMLNGAANAVGGVPANVLNLALLSGIGVALSAIGSAVMTRVAIKAAMVSVQAAAASGS